MKIQLKYEVMILDDEGNVVVDANAQLNVANVGQLVNTIQSAIEMVAGMVDEAKAKANTEFETAMAKAMTEPTEVN